MRHFCIFALFFFAPAFSLPAESVDLVSAIPVDAQGLVNIPSVERTRERFQSSAWGSFMDEPQMQAILDFLMAKEDELMYGESVEEDEDKGDGLFSVLINGSFSGALAVYLRMEEMNSGSGVVLVAPGEDREAFDEFRDTYLERLNESEETTDSAESYNDLDILIWEKTSDSAAEEGSEEQLENAMFFVETEETCLFMFHGSHDDARDKGLAEVQRTLDRLAGEGDSSSIYDSAEFMDLRDRFSGPNDFELYVDLGWWTGLLQHLLQEEWEEDSEEMAMLQDLGLDDFGSIYETMTVGEGENLELSLFVGLSGEGLIRRFLEFAAGDPPMDHLATIPAHATSFSISYFDFPGLYNKFMEEFEARFEGLYNQFRELYNEYVINRFKIDPEKELLALLDGSITAYSLEVPEEELAAMQGAMAGMNVSGVNQGGIYLLGIKDRETFQKNFEKTLRALGVYVSMKKVDFQGHRIYSIQTPMGMRLHWIYSEDVIAITVFPTAIRSYIRLLAHEDQPSVRSDEACMSFIESHPGASTISASKTSLMIMSFLKVAESLLAPEVYMNLETMEVEEETGPELPPFPGKDVVDRHFKGLMGTFIVIDEDGVQFTVVTQ